MPSWKKVLVSGSNIEVAQITSSVVPTVSTLDTDFTHLLGYNSDGGVKKLLPSSITTSPPVITLEGINSSSVSTISEFDTGDDYLIFSASADHGFGFKNFTSGNTSSIILEAPQALKTTSVPTFDSIRVNSVTGVESDSFPNDTFIKFADDADTIEFNAGGIKFLEINENDSQDVTIFNPDGTNQNFRVEGASNENTLFVKGSTDQVAIATSSPVDDNPFTVNGNVNIGGITGSFPEATTGVKKMLVLNNDGGVSGRVEQFNIFSDIGDATASLSSSIVGTAFEVEVTAPNPGEIKIGLPDNVQIDGELEVVGNLTASNFRLEGDMAIGGNIGTFGGFSFIEGLSGNFSGSNVFGSGSTPGANDISGGGTAHKFTGSLELTGSHVILTGAGELTALSASGSFAYLTANGISSSGDLYADLTDQSKDKVVVYDDTTGKFFYTASSGVGVTNYEDLAGIPDLINSGAIALVESAQGEYDITVGGITVSDGVSAGLLTSDSPTFTDLTLTGDGRITGSLTVNGNISGSGALFANLSDSSTLTNLTVVYDPNNGQFHTTGSYGGSGGVTSYLDLTNLPTNISSSDFTSDSQGTLNVTQNGSSSIVDLGVQTGDTPTFSGLNITNNAVIGGNLTVNGSMTTISTTNMVVEDTFILLASGSAAGGTPNDGGIIVEQATSGEGVALFWDETNQNWAIDKLTEDAANNNVSFDVNVATIQLNALSSGDNNTTPPSSTPIMGTAAATNQRGHLYVDTSDEFGLYVYL